MSAVLVVIAMTMQRAQTRLGVIIAHARPDIPETILLVKVWIYSNNHTKNQYKHNLNTSFL
jgi:hypothetical protein